MNIVNNILVPVDFSDSATGAIKYVVGMAAFDTKLECILYHVLEDAEKRSEVEQNLMSIKESLFDGKGIKCWVVVRNGDFLEKLIEDQIELKVDLIVMGTTGHANNRDETHAAELLQGADCPALIIPEGFDQFRLKKIALALDENEFDNSFDLQVFHDFAKWYNAKVHLIKVDKTGQGGGVHELKNEDTVEYYMESLDYLYSFPKNEDIEKGILDYVRENDIDALAIMPRTHAKKTRPSEGRLTKVLAKHSTVPLLVLD